MADPIFRTVGAWGAGKGSNLTAGEVDGNFWALLQRLVAVEDDPPEPNNISNIQVVGNQMKIFLEDATVFGPFTLPTALFRWQGEWQDATDYDALDLVTVAGRGVYLATVDTTSESGDEFDPTETDSDDAPIWIQIFGQTEYEFGFSLSGPLGTESDEDELLWLHPVTRDFYFSDLTKSKFELAVAPDGDLLLGIMARTDASGSLDQIGTVSFADGIAKGTVTPAVPDTTNQLLVGGLFGIKLLTANETANTLAATFSATKGLA